jgi:hypothetical protein
VLAVGLSAGYAIGVRQSPGTPAPIPTATPAEACAFEREVYLRAVSNAAAVVAVRAKEDLDRCLNPRATPSKDPYVGPQR